MADSDALRNQKKEMESAFSSQKLYPADYYVRNKVIELVADTLGVNENEIHSNSSLIDLGADSLDAVELVMEIEEEFNMIVSDDEAESVSTVGDIVRIVEGHI